MEDKTTIQESKYINQSLFMLQMVIMALNKKAKGQDEHIPFRNSMMTMILRDSLGGNCRTKMVATISALKDDMGESLGTCRFARSVQMVQNDMKKNETVDPGIIIQRLKKEVADLKSEISLIKGEKQRDHLSAEDVERCNQMVAHFVKSTDPEETLVLPDRLMINQCFYQFRNMLKQAQKGGGPLAIEQSSPSKADTGPVDDQEVKRLNMLVKQRDNEIAILLNYLNKKKEGGAEFTGVPVQRTEVNTTQETVATQEESKDGGNTLYQMMRQP